MHSASLNACLCRVKPCSSMGIAVSQEEAPFSAARSIDFWRVVEIDSFRLLASSCWFILRHLLTSFFSWICDVFTSYSSLVSYGCWQMRDTSGSVMVDDAPNWLDAISDGIAMPRPPCRTGSAKSFLSSSVITVQGQRSCVAFIGDSSYRCLDAALSYQFCN